MTNHHIVAAALLGMAAWANAQDTTSTNLPDQKSKVSYALGLNIGTNLKRQGFEIDPAIIAQGMKDVLAEAKLAMTEEQARQILQEYQQSLFQKAEEARRAKAEENKKAGAAWLAENSKKEGVVTLPSGLQYKVLSSGSGKSAGSNDTVSVNYRGTLINGKEFDSSYKRGQPAKFNIHGVIRGWTEALLKMKEGDKWQLFVPQDLAYGDRPMGNDIEPGSTLIFEVELLEVISPQPITSDIIKVPSAEEMAKGAKIETIKASDLKRLEEEARKAQQQQPQEKAK